MTRVVTVDEWIGLTAVIEEKQNYLDSVVESINAQVYKNTKAKRAEEKQSKIRNKIDQAKSLLRQKISAFKILINTTTTKMLNFAKRSGNPMKRCISTPTDKC
jgi:predicted translin family RNA/ssDNA-binding protein